MMNESTTAFTSKRLYIGLSLLACCLVLLAPISNEDPQAVDLERDSAFDTSQYLVSQDPYQRYLCVPRRVHLSQESNVMQNNTVSMTVSFSLDYSRCATAAPKVLFSQGFHIEKEAPIIAERQFNFTSSVNGQFFESDWIYHALLPDLQAGKVTYGYRIVVEDEREDSTSDRSNPALADNDLFLRGSNAVVGLTPVYTFITPPLPHTPTTVALIGDLGQTYNSSLTMRHILDSTQANHPERLDPSTLILLAGDLSYADSKPFRWIRWLDIMEPLLRSTPMSIAAGNHEIECDKISRTIFSFYENYFMNPNRIAEAEIESIPQFYLDSILGGSCSTPSSFLGNYNYGNAFYSFQHGLIQFIVLSSYSNTTVGSIQYEWLEEELKEVDRSATPWLIVSFHCPLYTTFRGHINEAQKVEMKNAMEPLFVKYGVNFIVSGHDHAYMRTTALAFGEPDPTGRAPIYLTLGAGGNREEHAPGYIHDEPEDWVVKRDILEYGFGHFTAENATHAHFRWIRDGTTDKGVRDDVWFSNPHYPV